MFYEFFKLGFEHILDFNGYDHILFVFALCAVYTIQDWKKVLILVTAFTVGHSLTLALSVLKILKISPSLIETLIPLTIIITGLNNIIKGTSTTSKMGVTYFFALFFGLIHGLGFSNYLNTLLDSSEDLLLPLFGFNLGVEGGQIVVVAIAMLLSYIFLSIFKQSHKHWNIFISSLAILVAIYLIFK